MFLKMDNYATYWTSSCISVIRFIIPLDGAYKFMSILTNEFFQILNINRLPDMFFVKMGWKVFIADITPESFRNIFVRFKNISTFWTFWVHPSSPTNMNEISAIFNILTQQEKEIDRDSSNMLQDSDNMKQKSMSEKRTKSDKIFGGSI